MKKKQAGNFIIDQVGVMKNAGLVWFYPCGINNISPQFRMVSYSKWHMNYNKEKHDQTSNVDNLYYYVTELEGFRCEFTPNLQGLHTNMHKVDEQTDENMFGTKFNKNVTMFGSSFHTVIQSEVYNKVDDNDTQMIGVQLEGNNADDVVDYPDEIETTQNSRDFFPKETN